MNLRELRLLGRDVTARKLWNAARVSSSYYVSRALRKPVHWGLPISIGIEPTTACNLGCPQCPSGLKQFTRPTGRLQLERFQALIDELHPDLLYLILYFQGEPYLNPQFLQMVEYATRHRVHTLTSTNAHFLSPQAAAQTVEAGLGRIVISLDGTTQEVYEQYRVHGNLEKVLEGTNNLVTAKRLAKAKRPFVDLQFIVFKHNQHQIADAKALGKRLGVDRVSLKTAQVYDYGTADAWIPDDPTLARYIRDEQTQQYRIQNRLLNHCWKLWHGAEITWDGRVLPCCFDKDARHEMGRFPEEASFRSIWRSEPYRTFRAQVLNNRRQIDICQNCTEGLKVRISTS
jgi:radical SAM protein with 4Fe4S-binding SPASM domain